MMMKKCEIIPKLITKLKQKNEEHMEAERANENLREQMAHSVTLNQKLIDRIGEQLKEIFGQQEEIWQLEEKLRNQIFNRNDDFFSKGDSSTISTYQTYQPASSTLSHNY